MTDHIVGKYADVFQRYIYHRLEGQDLFYNVTAREVQRYDWSKPYDRETAVTYLQFSRCPGYMWRRKTLAVMTIEDARRLYPIDDQP